MSSKKWRDRKWRKGGKKNHRSRKQQQAAMMKQKEEQQQADSKKYHPDLQAKTQFHNPYTFVETPSRKEIAADTFPADYNPLDKGLVHDRLAENLWSGKLRIRLTVQTPMLLPAPNPKENKKSGHKTYDCLSSITESSFRGMLRSAYEITTNSRYGVFKNDDRLGFRKTAKMKGIIPAIIERDANGELQARLYKGKSPYKLPNTQPLLHAAAVRLYVNHHAPTFHSGIPDNGDAVIALVKELPHGPYRYLTATDVWSIDDPPDSVFLENDKCHLIEGIFFKTNQNQPGKHDERIFFGPGKTLPVNAKHWKELIKDYQAQHSEQDVFGRNDPWKKGANSENKMAWSWHIYQDGKRHRGKRMSDASKLREGMMAYAKCRFGNGDPVEIEGLYPVSISRDLHEVSPASLIKDDNLSKDDKLLPAENLSELSPADRLFGWVAQKKQDTPEHSYKGRVDIIAEDGNRDVVDRFDAPLPLPVLGQPKPSHGRFYLLDESGEPEDGKDKENAGYKEGKRLRGRKQYWHHRTPATRQDDYWEASDGTVTNSGQNGWRREFIHPKADERNPQAARSNQNRSITGWIPVGTEYHFTLPVKNLQDEEVGALLWLLTKAQPDHYFRLGYGKPLGFGAVTLELQQTEDAVQLAKGSDWKRFYSSLASAPPAKLDAQQQNDCLDAFTKAMTEAYGSNDFEKLPFVETFLKVLRGPDGDLLIHYPRTSPKKPDEKGFKWFVNNERGIKHGPTGPKKALPKVMDDTGLPYNSLEAQT